MRILVTNDDGIDAIGLHVLVRAVAGLGEVTVVAPDGEYSGSSAAIGALHKASPVIHDAAVPGAARAYAVSGPPGSCVFLARFGVFGPPPDLVVAGINPGANVGRLVYHSGTVGAALTARAGGISGIAFSQEVRGAAIEGQGADDAIAQQRWETAGAIAAAVTRAVVAAPPPRAAVLNVNVPHLPLERIRGWRYCRVGTVPPRSVREAWLEPRPGHSGQYTARFRYGERIELPEDEDTGAVGAGFVSLSWLGVMSHEPAAHDGLDGALDDLLGGGR